MTDHFKSENIVASSGRSESLFSDIRHVTNINRPITSHLFLSIFIDFLDGTIKLARGFIENEKLKSPIIKKSMNLNESRLAGLEHNNFMTPLMLQFIITDLPQNRLKQSLKMEFYAIQ